MLWRRHPHCPPTVPKPFVEALPAHPGFDRGLIKKGRSLPTTGLILSPSMEGGLTVEQQSRNMNLIYPAPNSGKEFSRCTGGVLGIGLPGVVCGSPR
jgi:hypothetical protein